jgi:hypothetical protein
MLDKVESRIVYRRSIWSQDFLTKTIPIHDPPHMSPEPEIQYPYPLIQALSRVVASALAKHMKHISSNCNEPPYLKMAPGITMTIRTRLTKFRHGPEQCVKVWILPSKSRSIGQISSDSGLGLSKTILDL